MKLIEYLLESFQEYKIEKLNDNDPNYKDLYYIDNVKLKDLEEIKKNKDYKIINLLDMDHNVRSHIILDFKNKNVINTYGVINLKNINKNFINYKVKGMIFLKKSEDFNETKEIKKYNSLQDLESNIDNLGLIETKHEKYDILCLFDKNLILNQDDKINLDGILFAATFIQNKKNPYGANMMVGVSANTNVNGKEIVYPMIASYNKKGLIYPYRERIFYGNLSKGSRTFYYNLFTKNNSIFKIYSPIDNVDDPITDTKKDDNPVYNDVNKRIMDKWNKIKSSKNGKEQSDFLRKVKSKDFIDWTYILNKDYFQKSKVIIRKIKQNKIDTDLKEKISSQLLPSLDDFFYEMSKRREK
jgi:hypothetical protein